jgi:hypothetical protein
MDDFWRRLAAGPIPSNELPETLDVSVWADEMDRLWAATVASGAGDQAVEQAATVILDSQTGPAFVHALSGTPEGVTPCWEIEANQQLLGGFHTHALFPPELYFGVGFGPEDLVSMINRPYNLSLLRSGRLVAALIRTEAAPPSVIPAEVEVRFQEAFRDWYERGLPFVQAIFAAGAEVAKRYGLAVYSSAAGEVLRRM